MLRTANPRDLIYIANEVLPQIGFPVRQSILSRFEKFISNRAEYFTVETQQQMVRDRIIAALDMLFEVCVSLRKENPTGKQPIVLFDDIYNLIQYDEFSQSGGADIFASIATNIMNVGIFHKQVRSVVAGSRIELQTQLEYFGLGLGVGFGHGAGLHHQPFSTNINYNEELDEEAILNLLRNRKASNGMTLYQIEDVKLLLQVCGTRIFILQEFIHNAEAVDIIDFIKSITERHVNSFLFFLDQLPHKDAEIMIRIFDIMHENGTVLRSNLPKTVFEHTYTYVLFIGQGQLVYFQNEICRYVWKKVKKIYLRNLVERMTWSK
jgi:hypothetical protein